MRKHPVLLAILLPIVIAALFALSAQFLSAQETSADAAAVQDEPLQNTTTDEVAAAFTYQGLLQEEGEPVNGARNVTFYLHANAGCSEPIGAPHVLPNVLVEDGLFSVEVPVDALQFSGQGRWLEVEVAGMSIGCQALLPVPYALSLRPGAVISGTTGIRVLMSDTNGAAITGRAIAGAGATAGVWGEADSMDGYGGYFANNSTDAVGPDVVLGDNTSNDEGNLWSAPDEPSSDVYLRSNDEIWLDLDQNNDEAAEFRVRNGANTTVFRVDESGNSFASGTKSAIVQTAPGEYHSVYAMESPLVVLEDFGSARLHNGAVTVDVDPLFAQTANLAIDYQVFLTPVDGWAALYVTKKSATSFEVRDAEGQSSVAFDYRIVAQRQGYEDVRLEPVAPSLTSEGVEADD